MRGVADLCGPDRRGRSADFTPGLLDGQNQWRNLSGINAAEISDVQPRSGLQSIQMHGASGVSQDFPLAGMWTSMRTLRLADGPDEAHLRVVGRTEMEKYRQRDGDLLFKVGDPVRPGGAS